jgi:perosamine synthetase
VTGQAIPLTRPSTGAVELAAIERVLASGWLAGQGPEGSSLEAEFAELTGRRHAIAVNNCTAGLHLALAAMGVGGGDEVLVADYTFPATGHAVLYCGATPRFVDVRSDIGTIDVDRLAEAATSRTRAVIGVDALGMPADWAALEDFAREHDLRLLADAACSAGSQYRGQPCGSFGDAAVFSLHARKGITCGEGGVVVTDDQGLADRVRTMANFGMRSAFERQSEGAPPIPEFRNLGHNYKLADLLAAVARVQLAKLPDLVSRRRWLAARYEALLADIDGVSPPVEPSDRASNWQTYAIRVDRTLDRDLLVARMRNEGIGCTIGTYSLSLQPVYEAPSVCESAQSLFEEHLALPMFPELERDDQDRVVEALVRLIPDVPRLS